MLYTWFQLIKAAEELTNTHLYVQRCTVVYNNFFN